MDKKELFNATNILNNIRSGIVISRYDSDYTLMYCSEGLEWLLGYTKAELERDFGNSYEPLIHPEDKHQSDIDLSSQVEANKFYNIQYRLRTKSGEIIWVLEKGILITLDNNEEYLQYIVTDFTKEKLLEEEFEEKNFSLETMTNNLEAAIVTCSYQGLLILTYASQGFYRLTGYTKEEFESEKGNSLGAITHPEDLVSLNISVEKQLKLRNVAENTYRIVRRDGGIIWVLEKGKLFKNKEDKKEFHGVLIDITQQKQTETLLKLSKKKYEIAMDFAGISMYEYNVSTKKMKFDSTECRQFGFPENEPLAMELFIKNGFIQPVSVEAYRNLYAKIDRGIPYAREVIKIRDKKNIEYIYELSLTNIFDSNGKPTLAVGVKRDLTETFNLEKDQKFSNVKNFDQLLTCEANITKDSFIFYDSDWASDAGSKKPSSFFKTIRSICKNVVHPDDAELFNAQFDKAYLEESFHQGKNVLNAEYRRKTKKCNDFRWIQLKQHIIIDGFNDILIRCYITDIDDKKTNELKTINEQKLYEAMISKGALLYDVNLSKNEILTNNENWRELYDVTPSKNYSQMMKSFAEKVVHPDENEFFKDSLYLKKLLNAYHGGQNNLIYDYRVANTSGEFYWLRCNIYFYESLETGDICAHVYTEDIHEEKIRELALIYNAEHDALTSLYNKEALKKHVKAFLSTGEGKSKTHAFLIIDLDYFKIINDNFGHAFGDVVLSKAAKKIIKIFREEDILGRIGGDEFVAFMKNINDKESALAKAVEICQSLKESFVKNLNGIEKNFDISASIGIAFYKEHGKKYSQLYQNSDAALYLSKEKGKDCYTVYSDGMVLTHSSINAINEQSQLNIMTFDENVSNYIFRILYESSNKKDSIQTVLELMGKHFKISRVYVFEKNTNDNFKNTFEWFNPEHKNTKKLKGFSPIPLKNCNKYFENSDVYFIPEICKLKEEDKKELDNYGLKNVTLFAIKKNGIFAGFIGFDDIFSIAIRDKKMLSDMQNASSIIGAYILSMRDERIEHNAKLMALSIINGLDTFAYVCNPKNYKILFTNAKTQSVVHNAAENNYCYEAFWNRDAPCEKCPMTTLINGTLSTVSLELKGSNLSEWAKVTASWVDWVGGQKMCLLNSIDITKYKK